ncbi:hypothetical protein ASPSYDRAFT_408461 [Aspergillus sydowii CBS 593.65]|uniref:Secreted protein n=1 Tax=Aspergillus sydowii CBS 593.65 TaxID=1036612 RepID=A0A1L9TA89_9EURO|nr:uncharacterized protein ASPSYDRAFT_408461 [Aspergillus sydowii CBS 593.65]OJJ56285.1 hypothetical protein ASPSYDRAFT_408461 [Aspergillus sydowii CBS 593.65]
MGQVLLGGTLCQALTVVTFFYTSSALHIPESTQCAQVFRVLCNIHNYFSYWPGRPSSPKATRPELAPQKRFSSSH